MRLKVGGKRRLSFFIKLWKSLFFEVDRRMILKGSNLEYPSIYTFITWVILPGGYGFVNWFKYVFVYEKQ